MSDKLKEYQAHLLNSTQQALRDMNQRSQTNFHEHGLNQNGSPLQEVQNELNESQRVVVEQEATAPKKLGEGYVMNMGLKGLDEFGHALRAFHDPDTIPVAPSYLDTSQSPLQEFQQELPQPAMEQRKELER